MAKDDLDAELPQDIKEQGGASWTQADGSIHQNQIDRRADLQ
jgi:hypothetical protein